MRPNWVKIRYEYITTTISYRELAAKYHVSFTTLSKRAKREGWADRRKNNDDKVTNKMLEAFGKEEVKRRQNIMETANVLLDRLDAVLVMQAELDPRDIRILAAALKDIKDCKNCDADIREQEAKIRNLEKQASEENPVVSVEFKMPEDHIANETRYACMDRPVAPIRELPSPEYKPFVDPLNLVER